MHCINLFANGTVTIQPHGEINDRKIVIVHGHDTDAKNALEVMNFRWGLKPFAIQVDEKIEEIKDRLRLRLESLGIEFH